ncbi:MAG TPA: nuclear transport factor 2 family protein [Candidatus Limnocylindrales bacterium]|nr:nuclear transport factor 2 family protein [Candidatus Limnocylindrales bacterium]
MLIKDELEAVMERWLEAIERDDAAACAALCTEEAIFLSSDAPTARGRDGIEAIAQAWIDAGERNDRRTTLASGHSGDLGWLARSYAVDFDDDDGGVMTETGRYVIVFRRAPEGAWMIEALSIFASDLP